jgi:hypothetical protein
MRIARVRDCACGSACVREYVCACVRECKECGVPIVPIMPIVCCGFQKPPQFMLVQRRKSRNDMPMLAARSVPTHRQQKQPPNNNPVQTSACFFSACLRRCGGGWEEEEEKREREGGGGSVVWDGEVNKEACGGVLCVLCVSLCVHACACAAWLCMYARGCVHKRASARVKGGVQVLGGKL